MKQDNLLHTADAPDRNDHWFCKARLRSAVVHRLLDRSERLGEWPNLRRKLDDRVAMTRSFENYEFIKFFFGLPDPASDLSDLECTILADQQAYNSVANAIGLTCFSDRLPLVIRKAEIRHITDSYGRFAADFAVRNRRRSSNSGSVGFMSAEIFATGEMALMLWMNQKRRPYSLWLETMANYKGAVGSIIVASEAIALVDAAIDAWTCGEGR